MKSEKDLNIAVKKLHLQPGDLLLVKVNDPSTYIMDAVCRAVEHLKLSLPPHVRVLVMPDKVDFDELTKTEAVAWLRIVEATLKKLVEPIEEANENPWPH